MQRENGNEQRKREGLPLQTTEWNCRIAKQHSKWHLLEVPLQIVISTTTRAIALQQETDMSGEREKGSHYKAELQNREAMAELQNVKSCLI